MYGTVKLGSTAETINTSEHHSKIIPCSVFLPTCPWLMYTWTLPSSLTLPVAIGAPTNRSDNPSAFRSTAQTLEPK